MLLRELRDCCDPAGIGEISEGLEAMLNVPKRANDALHLSMLQVNLIQFYQNKIFFVGIYTDISLLIFFFSFNECLISYWDSIM